MTSTSVSRAGEKLSFALVNFKVNASGKICADFGSSTGGFVEVLLEAGAEKVYAIDTSYGELAWNLRNNPKVVVLERTNAMHVKLPEQVDLASIDVGWTKLNLVLPNVLRNLKTGGYIVALLKPHYEAQKTELDSGVVKPEFLDEVVDRVVSSLKTIENLQFNDMVQSPIVGLRGKNKEFLLFLSKV